MHVFGVRWVRHEYIHSHIIFKLKSPKSFLRRPYTSGDRCTVIPVKVVKHEILELFQRLVDGTCSSKPKAGGGVLKKMFTSSEKRNREKKTHQMLNLVSVS